MVIGVVIGRNTFNSSGVATPHPHHLMIWDGFLERGWAGAARIYVALQCVAVGSKPLGGLGQSSIVAYNLFHSRSFCPSNKRFFTLSWAEACGVAKEYVHLRSDWDIASATKRIKC